MDLTNIETFSSNCAFAAQRPDGSLVTWGSSGIGLVSPAYLKTWSTVPSELGGPCEGGLSVSPESYCGDSTWDEDRTCTAPYSDATPTATMTRAIPRAQRPWTSSDNADVTKGPAGVSSVDITSDNADVYDEGYSAGVSSVDITSDNADVYDEGYSAGVSVDITSDNAAVCTEAGGTWDGTDV